MYGREDFFGNPRFLSVDNIGGFCINSIHFLRKLKKTTNNLAFGSAGDIKTP